MDDVAGAGCNNAKNATRMGAGTMDNTDGPEGVEGIVDIITLGKINKTFILLCY